MRELQPRQYRIAPLPVRQLGIPIKLSRTPGAIHTPAPALGEHTREVLAEAGYSEQEVGEMLDSGAAAGPTAGSEQPFVA